MLYFSHTMLFLPFNFWQIASKLEVFPGSEFRVAYEEAIKYGGRVILGDRPVQVGLVFFILEFAESWEDF